MDLILSNQYLHILSSKLVITATISESHSFERHRELFTTILADVFFEPFTNFRYCCNNVGEENLLLLLKMCLTPKISNTKSHWTNLQWHVQSKMCSNSNMHTNHFICISNKYRWQPVDLHERHSKYQNMCNIGISFAYHNNLLLCSTDNFLDLWFLG